MKTGREVLRGLRGIVPRQEVVVEPAFRSAGDVGLCILPPPLGPLLRPASHWGPTLPGVGAARPFVSATRAWPGASRRRP